MAVYIRRAHKAEKLDIDLGVAHANQVIATNAVAITVLDKGMGAFTLTFHFYDGTEFTLNQDEISNGDIYEWDIAELKLTNEAQPGQRLKLLVDVQLVK